MPGRARESFRAAPSPFASRSSQELHRAWLRAARNVDALERWIRRMDSQALRERGRRSPSAERARNTAMRRYIAERKALSLARSRLRPLES